MMRNVCGLAGTGMLGAVVRLVLGAVLMVSGIVAVSCSREEGGGGGGGAGSPRVVLYSSVDDYLLREVVRAFEAETGIRVDLVGDTEATKTTGLVQRLLAERDSPRADVWWSSEAFGTIRLSEEGLLAPYESAHEAEFEGGWPAEMRGENGDWYGFASRARVLVYNTRRMEKGEVPTKLRELTDAKWRGRVGIARPEFGTTRGHMGALVAICSAGELARWLSAMRANDMRIYDGNATVVRAVAHGEIDIALTDTDDVWAGQREGWPVELVYETPDEGSLKGRPTEGDGGESTEGLCSFGPMLMPNTVAMVKGAPNPDGAARLIEFILSERVERLMAESESGNFPVRPGVAAEYERASVPRGRMPDLQRVYEAIPEAMEICGRVLR